MCTSHTQRRGISRAAFHCPHFRREVCSVVRAYLSPSDRTDMGPEKDVDPKQPEPAAASEKSSLAVDGQEKNTGGENAAASTPGAAEGAGEVQEVRRRASNRANGRVSEGSLGGRPKRRKPRKEGESHSQSEPEGTDREGGTPSRGGTRSYQRRTPRDRSDTRPRVDVDADDMCKRSLYIGNMSSQVTKDEVRALSDAIRSVRFVNRRSAFLDFESPEIATAQLELLRSMQLKGQPVQVEPSRPRSSSTFKSDRLLYVRGFPDDKGMDALGPLFPQALLIDRREGKVLLRFKDHESAISAIKEVIAHDGTDYKFSFAAARPRWNRRGPPRSMWRRHPQGKFIKHETRQD
uniref:Protein containing RRM-SF domain n=1 Tax=Rhipicephalus zambeziensis TaxID=60191 RepID=A0A224Z0N9_9ACAR